MTFTQAIRAVLRNYAEFGGRARRSEFWWFILFNVLVLMAAGIIDDGSRSPVLGGLVGLALFLPGLAVQVRRLHDTGRSGWWLLIGLLPIVGFLLLVVWFCEDGDWCENRFGPNPKNAGHGAGPPAVPLAP